MPTFKVEGTIEVELEVEAKNEEKVRALVDKHLEVKVWMPVLESWSPGEYVELTDSTADVEDFDIEEQD